LLSGTCGLAWTAVAGSRAGTGGISISPAPRLPREAPLPEERVRLVPLRALPLLPVLPVLELPLLVLPLAAAPAATGAGASASPHTLQ
jgi:hypothetical protein